MAITKEYERFKCKKCGQEADFFIDVQRLFRDPKHDDEDSYPVYLDDYPRQEWCLGCVFKYGHNFD